MMTEQQPKTQATICLILAVGSLAAGCATKRVNYRAPVDMSHDAAFTCIMRETTRAGFTVLDADREAGFVRAEKEASNVLGRFYTVVTFSVLEGEEGEMVTTANVTRERSSSAGRESGMRVMGVDREAARAILGACGQSVAVVEGS